MDQWWIQETLPGIPTALGLPRQRSDTRRQSFPLQYKDLRTMLLLVLKQLESLRHTAMAKITKMTIPSVSEHVKHLEPCMLSHCQECPQGRCFGKLALS